ncbi:unnamed protein product, partial [Linum tenue]
MSFVHLTWSLHLCRQLPHRRHATTRASFPRRSRWNLIPIWFCRRLYRFRTDARFSLPLGKATSPAAVPDRPFLHEMAISTSLIKSN